MSCQPRKKSYWTTEKVEGVALGMCLASASLLALFWALDITKVESRENLIIGLSTVLGTLVGAYLALSGIRKQIQDNRDILNDAASAELVASIAMLPLALTRLVSVCDNNVRRNYCGDDLLSLNAQADQLRELDPESASIMRDAIKASSPVNRERLSHILRAYQVAFARSKSGAVASARPYEEAIYKDHDQHLNALNWASVQAIAEKAFPYSRARAPQIPPVENVDVINALKNAGLDFDIFPNLGAICDIRAKENRLIVID